ncbi:MAG: hypothetical protein WBD46_17095 [Acidobacteriaceae bacterium]
MQSDPAGEWQRLTRLYGDKSDEELDDLADEFGNLTEVAQQVLRDERKKRGLSAAQAANPNPQPDRRPVFGGWTPAMAEQNGERGESHAEGGDEGSDLPREYTWKTLLCTCDTHEEAWQLTEVLRRAGIEGWIEAPAQGSLDVTGPRVMVAADQLEEARALAAQPIPQDIVDQSRVRVEDFVPPACPQCGAADPVLESVEPANQWNCENCGTRWKETATPDGEASSDLVP